MKRNVLTVLLTMALVVSLAGGALAQTVTIEYWQYFFQTKIDLIDELIAEFEAANPGIKVNHTHYPHAQFNDVIAASVPSGTGPDVVNLYYGWLPMYIDNAYLQPLPEQYFPVEEIERDFLPMVLNASRFDDKYWALPTGVRTLALMYNKTLFEQAGLSGPPKTWDEFIEAAKATTIEQRGRFSQVGFAASPEGQDHHLIREVLFRQWGVTPYTEDNRTVLYGEDPRAVEALQFYTDLLTKHRVGQLGFLDNYREAFIAGRVGMIVEGSFALGAIEQNAQGFEWGVAELPVREEGGVQSTFGSFWTHGITRQATGDKLEAAAKFLQFITSEYAMERWLDYVGELPARTALATDPKNLAHPTFGPFVAGLNYAHATFFADELEARSALVDAADGVILAGADAAAALKRSGEREQATLDRYFKD